MKKIGLIFLAVFALSLMLWCCESPKTYVVKITYCDGRLPKIIEVKSYGKPSNSSISNYKMAVPEYKNELNVCSVETISEK
jgi:hypothetical protein